MRTTTVLIVYLCVCPGTSSDGQLRADRSQRMLDRESVFISSTRVTREAYPNADYVYVEDFTRCTYEPNGTGVTWSDSYIKVLTERGRREKQHLSFRYVLPYGRVTIALLELIRPAGSIVPVDVASQSQVMIDSSQLSANIYDHGSKVLRVGVPDLQIGDLLHLVFRIEMSRRVMPNTWDDYQVFESVAPIKHATYEVHAPKARPLRSIALKDPIRDTVAYEKRTQGDRIVYRWEISNVPQFFAEPDMPPSYTVIQRLLVSTLPDWRAVSTWYWRLCRPHLEATTPEMRDVLRQLIEHVNAPQEKIEAIFHWVSQKVRYMGITSEEEAPGWEPRDVGQTFDKRHGVCRDKAALLVSMLRLAGFRAFPVLAGVGPKYDTEVPVVSFRHVIACVENDDGSYAFMDCTDGKGTDLLPAYFSGQSYLIARPEGERIKAFPVVPAEKNLVLVDTVGRIDSTGTLCATTDLRFQGINDTTYRDLLSHIKREEWPNHFERVLRLSVPAGQLTGFDVRPEHAHDTSEELLVRMYFTANDVIIGDANSSLLSMPYMRKIGLLPSVVDRIRLRNRRFPLRIKSTCGVRETVTLQIDPALGSFVSVPDCPVIDTQTFSWRCTLEEQANAIRAEREFLVKAVKIDPREYTELRDGLTHIEQSMRKMPILQSSGDDPYLTADAIVLNREVEYHLKDTHNWVERHRSRTKILSHIGARDNAELKLAYNPAWEEVHVIRATVSHGNQSKDISANEINLMDAEWVASAPRLPPGKILVAGLPAVQEGSVIDVEYERHKRERPFFSTTHVFRGFDPVITETVTLVAPSSVALRIVTDDNGIAITDAEGDDQKNNQVIVESVNHGGGESRWQWKVRNQGPVKREDSLPPLHCCAPVLRVTSADWKSYAQEVSAHLHRAAYEQMATGRRAREIVQQLSNPRDKVTALRDFVAKNVRDAGPAFDRLPLTAIATADTTLADGYGNTTDRAVLLHSMLDAAGLKPEFVLVSKGPPVKPAQCFEAQYPSTETFNEVLVRVPLDSETVYLNDTDEYAALGSTPAAGHLALPLDQGRTATVAIADDKEDQTHYECRMNLTEQGHAHIEGNVRYYGSSFAERNRMMAHMTPERRKRHYEELAARVSLTSVANRDPVIDCNSYPGTESFSVRVNGYAVGEKEFMYFELPMSLNHLFGPRSSGIRENPFCLPRMYNHHSSVTVELPRTFSRVLLMPTSGEWRLPNDGGRVRVRVEKHESKPSGPSVINVTCEARFNPCVLGPEDYRTLQDIEKELTCSQAGTILLTVPSSKCEYLRHP